MNTTQADREAAREAFMLFSRIGDEANSFAWGWKDDHALVRLLAAHRTTATQELVAVLHQARLQLEYLDGKFTPTGTTAGVLAQIDRALSTGQQP